MINLLSPGAKQQLRAARSNVLLLRYNILVGATILVMGVIFGGGFFITMRERDSALQQQQDDQARTANYSKVRAQAEAFEKNLTTAKKIVSQEIIYSTLLTKIAKTLPAGSVLSDISLTPESLAKPLALAARTRSYDDALTLKTTLESSPLFEDVNIVTITRDDAQEAYPFTVTLNATIVKAEAQS